MQEHSIRVHREGNESDSDCDFLGISIARYKTSLPWVSGGGIAIDGTAQLTEVEIGYPVTEGPFRFPIQTPFSSPRGYTLRELIEIVCRTYRQMYEEEDISCSINAGLYETTPLNRNQTHGKYGIWGHALSDLSLIELMYEKYSGRILYVGVDS